MSSPQAMTFWSCTHRRQAKKDTGTTRKLYTLHFQQDFEYYYIKNEREPAATCHRRSPLSLEPTLFFPCVTMLFPETFGSPVTPSLLDSTLHALLPLLPFVVRARLVDAALLCVATTEL